MLFLKVNKNILFVVIFAFLFSIIALPSNSYAKWDDKSDDLPGMSSITTGEIILIGVGVVALAAVIWYVAKSSKVEEIPGTEDPSNRETQSDSLKVFNMNNEFNGKVKFSGIENDILNDKSNISVKPILGMKNNSNINPYKKS
ncbi:MAG: hypothetical protein K8R79_10935, partial [Calditrichales bacterium]|nr:hypothetical protein [Calditrichales bacterium]